MSQNFLKKRSKYLDTECRSETWLSREVGDLKVESRRATCGGFQVSHAVFPC